MQDNRWCDYCGSDRGTKDIDWYIFEEMEMAFCRKHAKEMGLTDNDLIDM